MVTVAMQLPLQALLLMSSLTMKLMPLPEGKGSVSLLPHGAKPTPMMTCPPRSAIAPITIRMLLATGFAKPSSWGSATQLTSEQLHAMCPGPINFARSGPLTCGEESLLSERCGPDARFA